MKRALVGAKNRRADTGIYQPHMHEKAKKFKKVAFRDGSSTPVVPGFIKRILENVQSKLQKDY